MKKKYTLLALLLLTVGVLQSQVSFRKFFGTPSNADFGADVHLTTQGDFVLSGTTANGANGFDFFLLQTDVFGTPTGFENYGGPRNEMAQRLVLLANGAYLLLGYTESYGNGGRDGYAVRVNPSGAVLWTKTTGGPYDDYIVDGAELADGSLVIATNINTPAGGDDILLERWSANGDLLVSRTLSEGAGFACRRLLAAPDGIFMVGIAEGVGFLSKIQSDNLTEIWTKNYSSAHAAPQALVRMEDIIPANIPGQYLAVGRTASPTTNTVMTLDAEGNVLSKFNTLLTGTLAEHLATNAAGEIFIAGGDHVEHRTASGGILHETNGFDTPDDIPENIHGIVTVPAGGVAIVGNTTVYQQGKDAMFSLLDTALIATATRLFWTPGPDDEESGYSARQTADGGYLLCGEKYDPDNREDVWLIKTDASGNVIWEKSTGSSGIDVVRTLDLSGNDAFVVTGFSYDVQLGEPAVLFVRKFDLSGNELWVSFFPLNIPNFNTYTLIRSLADGGYLIALSAPLISATRKPTLLRLDAQGNEIWSKVYEDFSTNSFLRNLIETPEGNLLGVGASATGVLQATLFDASGEILWGEEYGGQNGIGYGVAAMPDGHFVISGFTNSDGSGNDSLYVAKIDALGIPLWEQYIEGDAYFWPRAHINETGEVFITTSIATSAEEEYTEIRKLDATTGATLWTSEIHDLQNVLFFESQITDDGGFMLFGYADNNNSRDYCLVKTNAEGVVNTRNTWDYATVLQVFPSPAQADIYLSWDDPHSGVLNLEIFDARGICLEKHSRMKQNGRFECHLAVGHLPAGAYFVRLVTDEGMLFKPFIKG